MLIFLVLFFSSYHASADIKVNLIHTSDIHGHFLNTDSPLRLGGVARLKTKIDSIREKNSNHLLLDSGDWTEGSIFYTLNSGEANHRLMESFNYDAIVLGNHEWLVGPEELYDGFKAADFKIPVLSANSDFQRVGADLKKFIKPYVIKEVAGKRIGILGLSTFEIIYDSFFKPAKLIEPTQKALEYVKILKEVEKCDVIIALTHTGIRADRKLAASVPGIDIILGGHSHILLEKPEYVNGVPIVHVGYWGQFVGEYELTIPDSGPVVLSKHRIHQIDETIPENLITASLVEGFKKRIEEIQGKVFDDKIFQSQVNLPLRTDITEDVLGNWAVDAIRQSGKTHFAIDVGQYFRRDLFVGTSSSVDFFNLFPHIFSSRKNRGWNIFRVDIKGSALEQLVNLFVRMGVGVKVSGAEYRIDGDENLFMVKNFFIKDQKIDPNLFYTVSLSEGVLTAFQNIKDAGADVGIRNIRNTKIETWKAIRNFVVKKSPITVKKAKWEGRVRTFQPDIHIPLEQVTAKRLSNTVVEVSFSIINAGLRDVRLGPVEVQLDMSPKNSLDQKWAIYKDTKSVQLNAGNSIQRKVIVNTNTPIGSGVYPLYIRAPADKDEHNIANNQVFGYFPL